MMGGHVLGPGIGIPGLHWYWWRGIFRVPLGLKEAGKKAKNAKCVRTGKERNGAKGA